MQELLTITENGIITLYSVFVMLTVIDHLGVGSLTDKIV